jgi:hypothetical protein
MKRSQSRFTPIEAVALLAIMAPIVVSTTHHFMAQHLSESICSLPDFRHHAACLRTDKDPRTTNNR